MSLVIFSGGLSPAGGSRSGGACSKISANIIRYCFISAKESCSHPYFSHPQFVWTKQPPLVSTWRKGDAAPPDTILAEFGSILQKAAWLPVLAIKSTILIRPKFNGILNIFYITRKALLGWRHLLSTVAEIVNIGKQMNKQWRQWKIDLLITVACGGQVRINSGRRRSILCEHKCESENPVLKTKFSQPTSSEYNTVSTSSLLIFWPTTNQ